MSEDIKMAELFKLPVSPIKGIGQTFIDRGLMLCDSQADAAARAINSHDKLVKQVAELRAALQSVVHKSYDNNETKQTIELFARKSLKEVSDEKLR